MTCKSLEETAASLMLAHAQGNCLKSHMTQEIPDMTSPTVLVINNLPHPQCLSAACPSDKNLMKLTETTLILVWIDWSSLNPGSPKIFHSWTLIKAYVPGLDLLSALCLDLPVWPLELCHVLPPGLGVINFSTMISLVAFWRTMAHHLAPSAPFNKC